jgi:hypothetical protein
VETQATMKLRIFDIARRQLRVTAHHEAGHAVASVVMNRDLYRRHDWVCGNFDRVVVHRPEDVLDHGRFGVVEGRPRYPLIPAGERTVSGEMRAIRRAEMAADVIESLAGPFAEARYSCKSIDEIVQFGAGKDDYAEAHAKAAHYAPEDGRHLGRLWPRLWKRSAALVRRPDVWRAVQTLAGELLQRWEIEGDEAVRIIDRAAGWQPIDA